MKIICTGGRDYKDVAKVDKVLDELNPTEVYVGDCPTGVDLYVRAWCRVKNVRMTVFEADWDKLGKGAGPVRNAKMVAYGTSRGFITVAFPGGKGTLDCISRAKQSGLLVLKVFV